LSITIASSNQQQRASFPVVVVWEWCGGVVNYDYYCYYYCYYYYYYYYYG